MIRVSCPRLRSRRQNGHRGSYDTTALGGGSSGTCNLMSDQSTAKAWPALPYEEWRETRNTLHMYTQVIGKLRLALSPFEPEWAHVPLYVSVRGLATSPIPVGLRTIEAEFDLIDHALVVRSSDGSTER